MSFANSMEVHTNSANQSEAIDQQLDDTGALAV
jgi:hypothetical protein